MTIFRSLRSSPAWASYTILVMIFGLSACTTIRYSYIPPTTDSGRLCAATCNTNLQNCIIEMRQATAAARQNCQLIAVTRQSVCLATTKDNDAARAACLKDYDNCTPYEDNSGCTKVYNQCYQTCGGEVIATEKSAFELD